MRPDASPAIEASSPRASIANAVTDRVATIYGRSRPARAMTCTTCHNPHEASRGAEASAHYAQVCRQCHSNGSHTASGDCIACHMPKRRTDDVVHAVMTDHYIQRRKPNRDLLAAVTEL